MDKLTLEQKNSLMVQMWMQENPSTDRVFALLRQLQEEKTYLLECLVKGDNEVRQTIWPQLEKVNTEIKETEWYINLLTNKQDN
jgi:tRNA nucleotidyltransferase (CCA-adding enzyme)